MREITTAIPRMSADELSIHRHSGYVLISYTSGKHNINSLFCSFPLSQEASCDPSENADLILRGNRSTYPFDSEDNRLLIPWWKKELINFTRKAYEHQKPILGICLGMQLLMDYSEEFGKHPGLGLLKGGVNKIKTKAKLPQIGWNTVKIIKTNKLTNNIKNNDWFYFVHSYVIRPKNNNQVFGITEYGKDEFCSIISYNQVYGVQFHPEKSSQSGLKIYHNFVWNVWPAASG